MSGTIVIVDAYSAGNLLAPEFRKKGCPLVHVQSTEEIWHVLKPTFRPNDFERNFACRGNLTELVEALRPLNPVGILPGTETGVELADRLSAELGLATSNGVEHSAARRNKYLMVETCRKAGLRVAAQCAENDFARVIEWHKQNPFPKYIVKPLNSAGTDQVAVCHNLEEIRTAFAAILGSTNKLGLANDRVLVQEFLEGTEYFLNTVSLNGKHHFTDIWRYQKRSVNGFDCVYDQNIFCPSDGAVEKELQAYVRRALDALGVNFGPAHTEVMLTPTGPALVEMGARLDGLSVVDFNREIVGYSPVDLTVDVYTDPEAFRQKAQRPYPQLFQARTVYLTSYRSGPVAAVPGEERLRSLESFFQMRLRFGAGSRLPLTTNYFTAPGFLSLRHRDGARLEQDYRFVRDFEKNGLFELAPEET